MKLFRKQPVVKIICLDECLPKYKTEDSAGMDLVSNQNDTVINPGEIVVISNGIKMEIPKGYEGQVRPRSGLSSKHGITVINAPGTIDADYRGEVKTPLINLSKEPYTIVRGERIAQMVIAYCPQAKLKRIETFDKETKRGDGGFGSTGV